jgi:hypothetical protein
MEDLDGKFEELKGVTLQCQLIQREQRSEKLSYQTGTEMDPAGSPYSGSHVAALQH